KKRGVKQHRTEIKLSPSGKEQGKGFRIRATPAPSPGASRHLLPVFERYPQVVRWTRASGTTCGKGEVPSLAKEGWPRHQVNGPVPLKARPGWFVQLPIIGGLNQPFFLVSPYRAHIRSAHARLRPAKVASRHFIDGASTPPSPRSRIPAHSVFLVCCKLSGEIRISEDTNPSSRPRLRSYAAPRPCSD